MNSRSPIDLLFLCNSPKSMGGTETTLRLLLRHLDPDLVRARVIVNAQGPFVDDLRSLGIDFELIPAQARICRRFLNGLHESLRRRPPQVVQLHLSRFYARTAHRYGAQVVERLNMNRHDYSWYPMRNRLIDCWTANWIDRFVVVSQDIEREFIHRGYPPHKMVQIYNGIDFPSPPPDPMRLRQELGISPATPLVGSVGRLTPQKGMDAAINVFAGIAAQMPQARFIIAGEGLLRHDLEAQAQAHGLTDKLIFLGYRPDVFNVLAALDLFVFTSRWEPFANTILEAMAAGIPILAAAIGGTPEAITHNHNGLLFRPGDDAAAVTEACRLLRQPELRQNLARQAKNDARRFTIKEMIERHQQLYLSMATT